MDTKRNFFPLLFVCRTGRNAGGPEVVFYSGTLFVSGRIRFQIASLLFSGGFICRGTAWDSSQYPFDVQDFFSYMVSFLHGVRIRHGNLGSDAFPVDDDVRPTATTGGGDTQPEPPEGRTIPIIAMTADAFAEDVKKARSSGMDEHIAKPLDIDKLVKVLQKWLSW